MKGFVYCFTTWLDCLLTGRQQYCYPSKSQSRVCPALSFLTMSSSRLEILNDGGTLLTPFIHPPYLTDPRSDQAFDMTLVDHTNSEPSPFNSPLIPLQTALRPSPPASPPSRPPSSVLGNHDNGWVGTWHMIGLLSLLRLELLLGPGLEKSGEQGETSSSRSTFY